jgi:hypothetical protein
VSAKDARAALHAPIRPYRSRRIAIGIGALQAVVLSAIGIAMPTQGPVGFRWYDRLGMFIVAALVFVVLWRFASVVALPSESGLQVRNLIEVRDLEWPQIVTVRFGGGAPWGVLDLADGDTMNVMALQRSDGPRGDAEASRLATLVELHSRTSRDD